MDKIERQIALMVDEMQRLNERLEYLEKASHQIIRAIRILSDNLDTKSK